MGDGRGIGAGVFRLWSPKLGAEGSFSFPNWSMKGEGDVAEHDDVVAGAGGEDEEVP